MYHSKQEDSRVPAQDLPPSYSETMGVVPPVQKVVQVVQIPAPDFGSRPVKTVCPSCLASITTSTKSNPSFMAWGFSAFLCFTMLWPCFCLPFCVDSLQNVKHSCPACKVVLGRYKV